MKKSKLLLILGLISGASFLPVKANAQTIDGWFEATKGIKQGSNLRLYPQVNIKGFNASSFIDINNFWSMSKNDISYEKIKKELGNSFVLKPVATYFTDPNGKRIMAGPNLSYSHEKWGYGFFELSLDPSNPRKSLLISYSGIPTKIGNLGLFTSSPIDDMASTYTELEYTAKDIKGSGVSPYARINLQKGVKPTYQVGLSINPKKLIQRFNRGKK